ncbi:MAG: hypothetical protein WBN22_01250 [Verrucomicrobiia bacterium]
MTKLNSMLSYKIRISALLVAGISTHLFAQSFIIYTDERWLSAQVPDHPSGYLAPSAPGADFSGSLNSFNSSSDYYVGSVSSTLSSGQLTYDSYLNLQGTIPPNGSAASFGAYCSVNFGVTSPVTATFAFDNFAVSSEGFTYDGLVPTIGIISDDPDFNPNGTGGSSSERYVFNASANQSDGSVLLAFSPDYTYTFFEQMTGFGRYDPMGMQAVTLNATLQANMSLTMATTLAPVFIPEPSSISLFLFGASFVTLWGVFRPRRMSAMANVPS